MKLIIEANQLSENHFSCLPKVDDYLSIPIAGKDIKTWQELAINQSLLNHQNCDLFLYDNVFIPRESLDTLICKPSLLIDSLGRKLGRFQCNQSETLEEQVVENVLYAEYSWQFLDFKDYFLEHMESEIHGTIRENVVYDGKLSVGEGSVILPGVYMEGDIYIGKDCKIGPNAYLRGPISIGDNCHIGNAVEIKASLLMNKVSVGHLSYCGDTIVGNFTNFGAGTITSNFRHDGKNHRSMIDGELIDTGRRKFGAIIGEHVHTGIHTSIYPGRKLSHNTSTLPGAIVDKDIS